MPGRCPQVVSLLRDILLLNTRRADTVGALSLLDVTHLPIILLINRSVELFLKDRIGLHRLEFGFEVVNVMALGAGVGTTTCVGEVVAVVLRFVARGAPSSWVSGRERWMASGTPIPLGDMFDLPVAFATSFLLDLLGISVDVSVLGEIAREMLDLIGSAVSKASVVTIVLLMGASHWTMLISNLLRISCLWMNLCTIFRNFTSPK